ncbi:MAG: DUF1934 domain-containing protein [Clostridiales bacterium]|nr:DUF1934 domain-containing protein [Clostridiales bacterium]
MTKEVLIHMSGMQTLLEEQREEDPLELITVGEYYFRNNTHYLMYDEMMEGFQDPVHNMIKIRSGKMEVRKKGLIDVQMIFEKDKKNLAFYKTPFGTMEMEIAATRVNLAETEKLMEIRAEYALGLNGSLVADCVMNLRVTPKGDKTGTVFFEK